MTIEDKELLLKDLCARLPYDVKVCYENNTYYLNEIDPACKDIIISVLIQDENREWCAKSVLIEEIKPYLRPMSSMTDDEREEFNHLYYDIPVVRDCGNAYRDAKVLEWMHIDWYNKHHFDYRGLIPKGLALIAPKGMYKMEEQQ